MADPPMPHTTRPPGASSAPIPADSTRHSASSSWCGWPSMSSSIPAESTFAIASRSSALT